MLKYALKEQGANADKSNMADIEKIAKESSTPQIASPAVSYANKYGETRMPQYKVGAPVESCEICGRKTPDGSLCPGCQEWVQRYDQIITPNR